MKLLRRLRALFRKEELDQNLSDELAFHLEKQIEQNLAAGMSVEEARYAALRSFGGVEQIKEDCRDAWGVRFVDTLLQDIRFGLRMLAKNPGFTVAAVLTLALGIGMNTAVFTVVNSVLFRALGYPNGDQLVWLSDYDHVWGDNMVSPAAFVLWRDAATSFESMVAYGNEDLALSAGDAASEERVASVTDGFWEVTGAQPSLGRLFRPGEPDTMVLSQALFERRFSGDPKVIGKAVSLNGHQFTITGVLARNFHFLFPQEWWSGDEHRDIDAYTPLPAPILKFWDVTDEQFDAVTKVTGPAPYAVYVVGKLKADVSVQRARAEMEAIYARTQRERYPPWKRDVRLHVAPLKDKLVGNTRSALIVLFGAVGFVLLIASANVANLLLARATTRRKEVAIRAAMGAGRLRLIRQFLAESVLLALLGGAAGVLVARWALAVMVRLGSAVLSRVGEATIDTRVLMFALAVSLATGVLFGLGPALSFGCPNLHEALKKDDARGSSAGAGRLRMRGMLVAGELALAIVLLTGAGLMIRSFWRMNTYPPGFAPEKILVMRVALSGPEYNVWMREDAYIHELVRRVGAVPGVQAVGIDRSTLNVSFELEGAPPSSSDHEPEAAFRAVSPGYLRALGVPLIKGSWPRNDESFDSLMVNETFVRTVMGSGNPIGRRMSAKFLNGVIVGVVADFKYWQLDAEPGPEVYLPYQLSPAGRSIRVIVRTLGDPRPVEPMIRKLASGVDPSQPVYEFQTLDQTLSDSIAPRRFNMFLLETFAAVALLMAAIGIYGVMAYWVTQRFHEIGIRMALGANKLDVLNMVVGQGLKMAGIGLGIGIAGALALTRFLSGLIYGVRATDPETFIAVSVVLLAVALAACYIPARRAAKVDPMVALRYE